MYFLSLSQDTEWDLEAIPCEWIRGEILGQPALLSSLVLKPHLL